MRDRWLALRRYAATLHPTTQAPKRARYQCTRCHKHLDRSDFYRETEGGYKERCKKCCIELVQMRHTLRRGGPPRARPGRPRLTETA